MLLPNQVNTTYASFRIASRDVASNGGAWYIYDDIPTTLIPHQSMGGMSDLFQLSGLMAASIRIPIPSEVAEIGATLEVYVEYSLSILSFFLLM
jgi:hypothetical protein